MKILYLNPCGQMGGAETSLRELLASLRVAAPDWELGLILGEDGLLAEEARAHNVKVLVVPFPPALARVGDVGKGSLAKLGLLFESLRGTLRYARSLGRILKSLEADVIHTNGFKMHLLGAWMKPRGTPLVWHIHDYVGARKLARHLLSFFHKRCDLAVANSKSVAADLRRLFPELKIVPVYNAVDLGRFSTEGPKLDLDALADKPAAPAGVVRVGLVATFARWKGHKVFLQALARLSPDVPVRGYIIGAPIYQTDGSQWSLQELEEEAARLKLGDRIAFTGFIRDTAAAMRSLDVVVHTSTEPEPFGMVIIEAMACGKAVIASDAGGAAELFVNDHDGVAHPPGDAAALAAQISRLAADTALRRRLGTEARATALRLYQGKRLASELMPIYRQLAGRPAESQSEIKTQSCLHTH